MSKDTRPKITIYLDPDGFVDVKHPANLFITQNMLLRAQFSILERMAEEDAERRETEKPMVEIAGEHRLRHLNGEN